MVIKYEVLIYYVINFFSVKAIILIFVYIFLIHFKEMVRKSMKYLKDGINIYFTCKADIKELFVNGNEIPKPYPFVERSLMCNIDILNIVGELNSLLPQLAEFIKQFNDIVTQSGINVVTDTTGNMSIDVPINMSDSEANFISKRIGVIDRLITTRGQEINELLQKGLEAESKLKLENPNYVSQLSEKITEFKRLNASYKH